MRVRVDEARTDDGAGGVDHAGGRLIDCARDTGDRVAANRHVRAEPRTAGAVQHSSVPNHEVVGGLKRVDPIGYDKGTCQKPGRGRTQSHHAAILAGSLAPEWHAV